MINQVGACMQCIGRILGYFPNTPAEEARANCILLNATDYISEGRMSFHPVKKYDELSRSERKKVTRPRRNGVRHGMLLWLKRYVPKILHPNHQLQAAV